MQENHNAALIVLDTLREDFSGGLEALKARGFVKYENAVSTSPWTLPSHVSMFTGELPSSHLVHESRGLHMSNIAQHSKSRLGASEANILRVLKSRGYTSYCHTCNPFISPAFGFEFDVHREYRSMIEMTDVRQRIGSQKTPASKALALLRGGDLSLLLRLLRRRAAKRAYSALGRPVLDKGSKMALTQLRAGELRAPFFIYVNIMEAHEPYRWGEPMDVTRLSILARQVRNPGWKERYERNAALAVERGLEAVRAIERYDPLVVVTSDHGQLLGEGGRYGHGYFLDESLLRAPLYVRFPSGVDPPAQEGGCVSLKDVRAIIARAMDAAPVKVGGKAAMAESFGPHVDLSPYLGADADAELRRLYATRRRVFSKEGSVVYNSSTGVAEEASGGIGEEEARELAAMAASVREAPAPVVGMTAEEETELTERLSKLGYE
ncbi:MAG: sulfatase-like hydrolase/transferase [Nitrososphaerota archaeon]|nr:sulfatase-like hydrolase/transferase [Nitrososphaerota archaeon]MDG6938156.1 sulfatase-like hydrolase/transferase [Nitrososphaerota archaeon]MDG6956246.1 sulfatase-like hydrolase/transferase [Nitrososphaerota archaeon]MDG6957651.1 sulfatase-like hydrolase/transferase [Nitrososphaerota archaeon]MDG6959742.1 sulfatase-like hydrolase/transferase [Nitrososphaerota archaeon]